MMIRRLNQTRRPSPIRRLNQTHRPSPIRRLNQTHRPSPIRRLSPTRLLIRAAGMSVAERLQTKRV